MREALDKQKLKSIYDRVAGHYDFQHGFLTARSDQRGRKMVVEKAIAPGNSVLDCGAGTGSTALLAAKRVGSSGKVLLFDLSEGMLKVAKERVKAANLAERCEFQTGDIVSLPFEDNRFDAVLSTYSICPLYDPAKGALEMLRVVKPGGRVGVAHSTTPRQPITKWLADKVENIVWLMPFISLGCRSVSVLPALEQAGGRVLFEKYIGIPLWPFIVFVVEKPQKTQER